MNASAKLTATSKLRVFLLASAALYAIATILVLYFGFLTFPPIVETADDVMYAVAFFYAPLSLAILALCALAVRFGVGTTESSRYLALISFLLSLGLAIWWFTFKGKPLPTIVLPAFFLAVVIEDFKERKRSRMT